MNGHASFVQALRELRSAAKAEGLGDVRLICFANGWRLTIGEQAETSSSADRFDYGRRDDIP